MTSHQNHLAPHRPLDKKGRQIKRSSSFLLGQLIFSLVGAPLITPFANAQTGTTCTGGDSCLDLYQGTISAIQAYGYQPPSLNNANASLYIQSFDGGVLNGGTMAFTQNGGTPGTDTINSVFVWNCPDAPATVSGTVYATVTVTNSSTLSSDTSVSNTNSSFNQGTNTVSLSYQTPPSPYGSATASDVMSYTWGSSTTNSSTSSSSSTTTDSSSSTTSIPVQYNLAPGQATTVQITLDTTVYSGDSWSAPVSLSNTVPLSNLQYIQKFPNWIPPNTTVTVSDNGTSVNGNAWYGPVSWTCSAPSGGCATVQNLADPSGQYNYWPTQYATIGGWGLTGPGTTDQIYWSGQSNGNAYQGMELYYSNTQVDGSYLYGKNATTGDVVWNPKVTEYGSLALLENGNLVALDGSNAVVWSNNAGQGVKTPSTQAVPSNSIPSPQQLLGSVQVPTLMVNSAGTGYTSGNQNVNAFAFYATGSYSSNSYDNTGTAGTTGNVAMTSDQVNSYCPNGTGGSGNVNLTSNSQPVAQTRLTFADNGSSLLPEETAGYTLTKASFGTGQQGSYQVAQNDVRRDRRGYEFDRRFETPSSEGAPGVNVGDIERQQNMPPQDKAIKRAVEGDGKGKKLVKVKHIKGPIVLRPNQFYASSSPGIKVHKVVVHSDNMTNFSGFAPGDSQALIDPKARDSRKVELKVGHQMVTNVKPRPGI